MSETRTLVFTGDGKGKTTAALGMVLRAAGHGMVVLVLQFVKGERECGEHTALGYLPGVQVERYGLGFVPQHADEAFPDHEEAARVGLERARGAVASRCYDLVVLDEVCYAIDRGLLTTEQVAECVRGATCNLVLTGRYCPEELIAMADTVTRMEPVKHGLQSGFKAQKGVEL
jgi:cob(I)alamin adenosyltransferase